MSWWYPGTVPPAPPRPVPDPYAGRHGSELPMDPCIRDHDFVRRPPRPEVVRGLCDLLYQVKALKPREMVRDPSGVPSPHDRDAACGSSVDVFLHGGPCAGDEVTLPGGHHDYRVPIFRRASLAMRLDSATHMSSRPNYDVARYRLQLDVCGMPARSTDGRQIYEFGSME